MCTECVEVFFSSVKFLSSSQKTSPLCNFPSRMSLTLLGWLYQLKTVPTKTTTITTAGHPLLTLRTETSLSVGDEQSPGMLRGMEREGKKEPEERRRIRLVTSRDTFCSQLWKYRKRSSLETGDEAESEPLE